MLTVSIPFWFFVISLAIFYLSKLYYWSVCFDMNLVAGFAHTQKEKKMIKSNSSNKKKEFDKNFDDFMSSLSNE